MGAGNPELEAKCLSPNKGQLPIDLANKGKFKFDGWVSLIKNGKELSKEKIIILRESQKTVHAPYQTEFGKDNLELHFTDLKTGQLLGKSSCKIP